MVVQPFESSASNFNAVSGVRSRNHSRATVAAPRRDGVVQELRSCSKMLKGVCVSGKLAQAGSGQLCACFKLRQRLL